MINPADQTFGSLTGIGEVSGDLAAVPVRGNGVVFHLDLIIYPGIKGSKNAI